MGDTILKVTVADKDLFKICSFVWLKYDDIINYSTFLMFEELSSSVEDRQKLHKRSGKSLLIKPEYSQSNLEDKVDC